MKKRCTNSACRRVFRPVTAAGRGYECPYCGKHYGAVNTFIGYRLYQRKDESLTGRIGLPTTLARILNISLHEAYVMAGSIRRPEGGEQLVTEEQQEKILAELRKVGVRSVRAEKVYEE